MTEPSANQRIFGFRISPKTAPQIADQIVDQPPARAASAQAQVALVVTPNIQHVAVLRANKEFRDAYDFASIIVCDGFPVHYYARLRGCFSPGRVTGCDIVEAILSRRDFPAHHRFFFVVDQETTATAINAWASGLGLSDRIGIAIPPFGFETDTNFCQSLAETIRDHGTTILFMGLGAPKSEIFVYRYREILPPCWALCIGQAVKIALGLTHRPPKAAQSLNLEWVWRIILEPKRMGKRYAVSVIGFLRAILEDLRRPQ